jgi:hypothetical protein
VLIRVLTLAGIACLAGGVLLIVTASVPAGVLLLLIGLLIEGALAVRAAVRRALDAVGHARAVVTDARTFFTGDVQHARLVDVGEPHGWFSPAMDVAIELEDAEGGVHRIDREVPVSFPLAWGYRLGKRLPGLSRINLTEMLAVELKREGRKINVSRPEPGEAPAE